MTSNICPKQFSLSIMVKPNKLAGADLAANFLKSVSVSHTTI